MAENIQLERATRLSLIGMFRGAQGSGALAISVAAYGAVFGVLAGEAHLSVLESVSMSMLVFAGTAQFAAIDIWRTPLPVILLFLQTLAINSRYILMGMAVRRWYQSSPNWIKYLSAFFMIDESWALSLQHFECVGDDPSYLIGSGVLMYVGWAVSTLFGSEIAVHLGSKLNPARWGLDVALPCVLLTLLLPRWRGFPSAMVWVAAAIVSALPERWLVAHHLPIGTNILIGALTGATVGMFVEGTSE